MGEFTRTYTLAKAMAAATQTRSVEIKTGAIQAAPATFQRLFGGKPAMIVADPGTFGAVGSRLQQVLNSAGISVVEPFIFQSNEMHAEYCYVDELVPWLKTHQAIPIAVGSGTLNDITKLAAHLVERPYMCVATAASMDGYTAYGSSITKDGAKQTFFCPAPMAVVADLDVIAGAPGLMNSWGYADLLAKVPAGADWIVADALGIDPIDPQAWGIVQSRLREMLQNPAGVRQGDPVALARLVEGLMLGGFAIQAAKSTRVASGAEHLFSHVWDMQHHTHENSIPSHGFKVGIGTLATTALYECLLKFDVQSLHVERCAENWPDLDVWLERATASLGKDSSILPIVRRELPAKYWTRPQLRQHLTTLKGVWPQLRQRLEAQLLPLPVLRSMLRDVGAPTGPEQIGITRERLRETYWQASFIRQRFMGLDLVIRMGLLEQFLDEIFGPAGIWPA